MNDEIGILIRRLQRAHKARKEAESLLEEKSLELYKANKVLEEKEEFSRAILDAVSNGIISLGSSGEILSSNFAACRMFGYDEEAMLKLDFSSLISNHGLSPASFIKFRVEKGFDNPNNAQAKRKDRSTFPVEITISELDVAEERYIALIRDVSEREHAEQAIHKLANYDKLTGLPNMDLFRIRIVPQLAYARRNKQRGAMLAIDINRFSDINESFGRNAGDTLLKEISTRLKDCVRNYDSISVLPKQGRDNNGEIARLGGDEFLIFVSDITAINDAARVSTRLLERLRQPYEIEGLETVLTASVGIAIYPDDGKNFEDLLRNASTTKNYSKKLGPDHFSFYDSSMNDAALQRLTLENELRNAVEREEFLVYFQPKADINSQKIVAAEALVRWQHPERGILSPGLFIEEAEKIGLLGPISEWVLEQTCRQIATWINQGLPSIVVSVNLSNQQFHDGDLPERVELLIKSYDIPPSALELELTETIVMENADQAIEQVNQLKQLGITLSIDDFGTGYSSLSYLRRLKVDKLKIDQSFVRHVPGGKEEVGIVESIISLGKNFGMELIAEGVETKEQFDFLREAGCDQAQGYLISKPTPANEMVWEFTS